MKLYRNKLKMRNGSFSELLKTFLLFLVLLFYFAPACAEKAQFLYLGVAPVFSLTNFQWTEHGQNLITDTQSNTQAAIFTGYGFLVNRAYFGLEASTQLVDRTGKNNTRDQTTDQLLQDKITMSDSYIFDFRPGYVLQGKNTLLYGIFGVNTANFQVTQEAENNNLLQASDNMRETGLRFGVGYNLGLGHYLMGRAEYVYTQFPNFNALDGSLHPSSSEFTVGLSAVLVL